MTLTGTKFKNEAEFSRALETVGKDINELVEALQGTGPGAARLAVATTPESLLEDQQRRLLSLLEAVRANGAFCFDMAPLARALLEPLLIQRGEATGMLSRQPELLALLHAWCWTSLRLVMERVDGATPGWPLGPVLRHFLLKYHCAPTERSGKLVYGAMFALLASLPRAYHAHLVAPLARLLIDAALAMLEAAGGARLSPAGTSAGVGVLASARRPGGAGREKKRGDQRQQPEEGEGRRATGAPSSGQDAQASAAESELGGHLLHWLDSALAMCEFQRALVEASRASLIQCLCRVHLRGGPWAALSLRVLGTAVLGEQPARLSCHLPLLLRLTAVALHAADPLVRAEARQIAGQADLLIRPRRPYAPKGRAAEAPPEIISSLGAPFTGKLELATMISPVVAPSLAASLDNSRDCIKAPSMPLPEEPEQLEAEMEKETGEGSAGEDHPIVQVIQPSTGTESLLPSKRSLTTMMMTTSELTEERGGAEEADDDAPLPVLIDEGPDEQ